MLELLSQMVQLPEGFLFGAAPACDRRQLLIVDAAAGGAGGRAATVKEEEKEEDQGFDDELDRFFQTLQLPQLPSGLAAADDDLLAMLDDAALLDQDTENLLQDLLQYDGACGPPQMAAAAAAAAAPKADAEAEAFSDDDQVTSSPASFNTMTASPMTPASPTPSSASSSAAGSHAVAPRVVASGRVQKKKEANREAAYRYRLKQRLGDSAQEQRRAELQSRADELSGGVGRAENEAQFLMQMCRQIFSSRKQLLIAGGSRLARH